MPTRLVISLGAVLAIGGCGGIFGGGNNPQIVNPPPPGISYRLKNGNDIKPSQQRADAYCGGYGKRAKLERVENIGTDLIVYFDCQ